MRSFFFERQTALIAHNFSFLDTFLKRPFGRFFASSLSLFRASEFDTVFTLRGSFRRPAGGTFVSIAYGYP